MTATTPAPTAVDPADVDPADAGPSDARRVALLLGVLFGLAGTGSSASAVALPALADGLSISAGASAWVISAYALTLAVSTAVYGRVADLVGIRTPLTVGVSLMASGALLSAVAPSLAVLITGRLLQGAGAGAIPVLGAAIISARYEGGVRAAALGRVAGFAAAVGCLGPLAGGALTQVLGWRAVVALPATALLLGPLLWRAVPSSGSGGRLDVPGALLVALASAGLVLLVQSPSSGLAVAVVGAVLLALGVPAAAARVRRLPHGFLPRSVVTDPLVVRSALAASAAPASWFALLVAVPTVLAARGWEPLDIGLVLLPSAVSGFLAPRLAAPVLARLGAARTLSVSGAAASVALLVAGVGGLLGSAPLLVAGVVLVTVAFGLGQPALTSAVSAAVAPEVRGVALGIATLVFLVGGGVGSAVVGGLGQVLGVPLALLLLAVLPAGGALVVLSTRRLEAERGAQG